MRLMKAFLVVKAQPSGNSRPGFGDRSVGVQVYVRVLQASPQPLDEDVVCALPRCTGSVGANPTRQLSLQPEAPGADQEATNGLKHSRKSPLLGGSGPCGPQ